MMMAVKADGIFLVSLGKKYIMAMVSATKASMM